MALPSDRPFVSPLEVSRALGVSETTVKRWVDEGKLPAHKTEGGHRRILVGDVVRYVRQRNWQHVNLSLLGEKPLAPPIELPVLQEEFLEALCEDNHVQAQALILRAYQCGATLIQLADEVISPAMAQIGHGWAMGEVEVYQEHRSTQVCLSALLALKSHVEAQSTPRPHRPLALGGGPEGDHYCLANLLLEILFLERGWQVVNVGPNTPLASLERAIMERTPALVWLSCSYIADVEAFLASYQQLYDRALSQNIPVCIGGRALTDALRERMLYTHYGDRLAALIEMAKRYEASM